MAQLDLENRQIPAHFSRQNFALIGAKVTDGNLHIAGRVDSGRILGKKLDGLLSSSEKRRGFENVVGRPSSCTTLSSYADHLNEEGAKLRFSSIVVKTIERFDTSSYEWVPAETAPEPDSKFRFLYELRSFEEPTAPTELHLTEDFYARRQRVKQQQST